MLVFAAGSLLGAVARDTDHADHRARAAGCGRRHRAAAGDGRAVPRVPARRTRARDGHVRPRHRAGAGGRAGRGRRVDRGVVVARDLRAARSVRASPRMALAARSLATSARRAPALRRRRVRCCSSPGWSRCSTCRWSATAAGGRLRSRSRWRRAAMRTRGRVRAVGAAHAACAAARRVVPARGLHRCVPGGVRLWCGALRHHLPRPGVRPAGRSLQRTRCRPTARTGGRRARRCHRGRRPAHRPVPAAAPRRRRPGAVRAVEPAADESR